MVSGAIVERLILRQFEGMKFAVAIPNRFCRAKILRQLHYHLLSHIGFWLILSFTGKGLCTVIHSKTLSSGDKSPKSATIALQPLTEIGHLKFPIVRSALSRPSNQAKDLASTDSSENLSASIADPAPIRSAFMPDQVISTTQKNLPQSVQSPVFVQNRCWRSLLTNCAYTTTERRIAQAPDLSVDSSTAPEIGDLRLSPLPDSELGLLQIQPIAVAPSSGAGDSELGTLRLQERSTPQPPIVLPDRPRQPTAYLLARADYFKSSNVFSDIDPVDDGLARVGLTFFYAPPIGSRTFLITSIDANLVRYSRLGQYRDINGNVQSLNYDELRFRAGIFHRITPRLSAEVGWSNQKLFASSRGLERFFSGREFFGDNSIRVELSRQDTLSPRLLLSTYYQFRWSLANPDDRSRILNSAIATLSYNFTQQFQTAIDYQFTWSHFTQQVRDDLYHQLIARVSYNVTRRTQINIFSGFSFGNSSDRRIDFNSFIFGAGLVFSLPLF